MDRQEVVRNAILSQHARQRAAQRNLSDQEIRYAIRHGKRFHRRGVRIYYLRRRDLPKDHRASQELVRLIGTAVVTDSNGETIITVWRDREKGLKQIKQMPDYRIRSAA